MAGKLLKDWFNRRAEDSFTFNNEDRLFNWDEGRSRYSSYFIRDNDALAESAKIVGSMFRVMGVDKSVDFIRTQSDVKNKKTLHIPIDMIKEEPDKHGKRDFVDINDPRIDAFYGTCIQNAALHSFQSEHEYYKTMRALNTNRNVGIKELFFSVLNNERIEKKLSERFPGYLKLVQKMKDYRYDQNYSPLPDEAPEQQKLMDLVLRMLRYPAHITQEEMDKYADPLKSIERLIKKFGGMPKTSDECDSMARSISLIINKYDPTEPPPPTSKEPGEGEGEDEDSSPSSSKISKDKLDEMAREFIDKLFSNSDKSDKPVDTRSEIEDFQDFVAELENTEEATADFKDEEGNVISGKVEFRKIDDNKQVYLDVLKKIDTTKAGVLRKLFARKNKDYDFAIRSMRTGRLDTNKIAEARQGVPTIYERIGNIKTDKITVTVLIDESGSMMNGSKIAKAQEAAIFINEVFSEVPNVELFIYGHTADERRTPTNILVYKEPGAGNNKFALGNVEARSNNRDGHAILSIAKRVRKFTKNAGILLVLSDGQPSANGYGGKEAIADTRKSVTEAQKLGFQVIQIAIEEHVPSEKMFDYFIKMTDIKNLPMDMVNYLSRKVDRLVKERITL